MFYDYCLIGCDMIDTHSLHADISFIDIVFIVI